jgi:hypothetical protein
MYSAAAKHHPLSDGAQRDFMAGWRAAVAACADIAERGLDPAEWTPVQVRWCKAHGEDLAVEIRALAMGASDGL